MNIFKREILPEEALTKLKMYADEKAIVKVVEDPYVYGTYALEVTRFEGKNKEPYTFHLLWSQGEFNEVEFESFPPHSDENNLKFL